MYLMDAIQKPLRLIFKKKVRHNGFCALWVRLKRHHPLPQYLITLGTRKIQAVGLCPPTLPSCRPGRRSTSRRPIPAALRNYPPTWGIASNWPLRAAGLSVNHEPMAVEVKRPSPINPFDMTCCMVVPAISGRISVPAICPSRSSRSRQRRSFPARCWSASSPQCPSSRCCSVKVPAAFR